MYTKIGCTHVCICTYVRQCTVLLKCTYSYLKKYMYLKSFFIQKYPLLIWLCIHFLQSSLEDKEDRTEDGEDTPIGGLHQQQPLATTPLPLLQRGRWRVVLYFLFSPTVTFYVMTEFQYHFS